MSFQDLLNKPLPSQSEEVALEGTAEVVTEENDATTYLESIENELFGNDQEDAPAEECGDCPTTIDTESGCATEGEDNIPDEPEDDEESDLTDLDIDDMSDEELAALDASLSGDSIDDASDIEDIEDEEELTPEEEIEADDMMSVAATTMLIKDELNAEERAKFLENASEVAIAINEGFLTESDINMLAVDDGLVTEAKYTQKMIIRLDAEAKKKQLYALAVNVSAAAHNDKDYMKLKKVMRMRKILRARLDKKYHNEATKRMKVYFKRLRNSKSNTMSSIGHKADK